MTKPVKKSKKILINQSAFNSSLHQKAYNDSVQCFSTLFAEQKKKCVSLSTVSMCESCCGKSRQFSQIWAQSPMISLSDLKNFANCGVFVCFFCERWGVVYESSTGVSNQCLRRSRPSSSTPLHI